MRLSLADKIFQARGPQNRYLFGTILVLLKLQCLLVRSGVSTSIGAGLWVYVGTALVRPTATSKSGDPRRRSVGEHPF